MGESLRGCGETNSPHPLGLEFRQTQVGTRQLSAILPRGAGAMTGCGDAKV